MAKELLVAVHGGKADGTLRDRVAEHLRPLLQAKGQAEAKRKSAASAYGQFVLQLGTTVGRAMTLPMLGKTATEALLAIAGTAAEALILVSPYAKVKQPLQVEKLAMGLIQKHVDAKVYSAAIQLLGMLADRLSALQSPPRSSIAASAAVLGRYTCCSAVDGAAEDFLGSLAPHASDSVELCTMAMSCLNARAACLLNVASISVGDAHRACSVCLVWLAHAESLKPQLSRRHRTNFVRLILQSAVQVASDSKDRSDVLGEAFSRFGQAIEVMMLGSEPLNVNLQMCVEHMVKTETRLVPAMPEKGPRRTRSTELTDSTRAAAADAYGRAIACIMSLQVTAVEWAVPECYRLTDRYSALCVTGCEPELATETWRKMISWCSCADSSAAPRLAQAAAQLQLGLSCLDNGVDSESEATLQMAAELAQAALGLCFEAETAAPATSSDPSFEYFLLLRMVVRGGVFVKAKDQALALANACTDRHSATTLTPGMLLALESLMCTLSGAIEKGCSWEAKAQREPKFGKLIQTRISALHVAYQLRAEHGIIVGKGAISKRSKTPKAPTKAALKLRQQSMEVAVAHLVSGSEVAQAIKSRSEAAEMTRSLASFSFNGGIRLSQCECYGAAIMALELSCKLLRKCASTDISALCSRFSLIGKCHEKMGMLELATAALLSGIAIMVGLIETVGQTGKNLVAPLVHQYVSVMLRRQSQGEDQATSKKGKAKATKATQQTAAVPFLQAVTEARAAAGIDAAVANLSREQSGAILEVYVEALRAVGPRLPYDTASIESAVIDVLLESVYSADCGDDSKRCSHLMLGRSRALLAQAQLFRLAGELPKLDQAADRAAQAVELLAGVSETLQNGSASQALTLEHVASAHTWLALINFERRVHSSLQPGLAEAGTSALENAVLAFSQLLQPSDASQPTWVTIDVENAWNNLHTLSDFFQLRGQHALHLHCLQLRYRLVSVCLAKKIPIGEGCPVRAYDVADILTEMSCLHTRLGYSERGMAFANAAWDYLGRYSATREGTDAPGEEERLSTERAKVKARLARLIATCRGSAPADNLAEITELLEEIAEYPGRSWRSIVAFAKRVMAEAYWSQGKQLLATHTAIEALQTSAQLLPGCQGLMAADSSREQAAAEAVPAQSIHDDESEDIAVTMMIQTDNSEVSTEQEPRQSLGSSSVPVLLPQGATSQWCLMRELLESLQQSGCYAAAAGRGVEAEAYLNAARNIAERVFNGHWEASLSCELASVHYRRRDFKQCRAEADRAAEIRTENGLLAIHSLALIGDCLRKVGDNSAAVAEYTAVYELIETMRSPKFLIDALYSVTVGSTTYRLEGELVAHGQSQDVKGAGWPTQLEELQGGIEAKHGRALCCSKAPGEAEAAEKLYKRALDRLHAQSPLRAIALYYMGCFHATCQTAESEEAGWSLRSAGETKAARSKLTKAKPTKKSQGLSSTLLAARDCWHKSLALASMHGMGGLTSTLCHRLTKLSGRRTPADEERSCRLLQASLCVPLCSQMQSLVAKRSKNPAAASKPQDAELFSLGTLTTDADRSGFQQQYLDVLPSEWTVCSCTVERVDARDGGAAALLVSRMNAGRPPVVLRIPVAASTSGDGDSLNSILAAWQLLIEENVSSLKGASVAPAKGTNKPTTAQKSAWWGRRTELDTQMCELLDQAERSWFGGFKGVLAGQLSELEPEALHRHASQLVATAFDGVQVDVALVEIVLASADLLSESELHGACVDLLTGQVGSHFSKQSTAVEKSAKAAAAAIRETSAVSCSAKKRGPTLLLLSQELQQLPWESFCCLRDQAVTRMPCLPFVLARLKQISWHIDPGVQSQRTFYVINPSGDLASTQETFEEAFSSSKERQTHWTGLFGKVPERTEYRGALESNDLFIYCGHSTGERYFRGSELAQISRCAVTMLMGCSSGKLRCVGDYGVEGMPLSYMLAGCPALVANLWDVTDRDIDKFSTALLDGWIGTGDDGQAGEENERSLASEIPVARSVCKLRYLNGASPVCYGVPVVAKPLRERTKNAR